jgi:hypothetical protein
MGAPDEIRAALSDALASLSGMHPEHAKHQFEHEEVKHVSQPEDVIDELAEDLAQERIGDDLFDR